MSFYIFRFFYCCLLFFSFSLHAYTHQNEAWIISVDSTEIITVGETDVFTLRYNTLPLPEFNGQELQLKRPLEGQEFYGEFANYGVVDAFGGRLLIGSHVGNNATDPGHLIPDRPVYHNKGLFDCFIKHKRTDFFATATLENVNRSNIDFSKLSGCVLYGREMILSTDMKFLTEAYYGRILERENGNRVGIDVFQNQPIRVAVTGPDMCGNEYIYCLVYADQIKDNGGVWKTFSLMEDSFSRTIGIEGNFTNASSGEEQLTMVKAGLPAGVDIQSEITKPEYAEFFPPYYLPWSTKRSDVCILDVIWDFDTGAYKPGSSYLGLQPSCDYVSNRYWAEDFLEHTVQRSEPSHFEPHYMRFLVGVARESVDPNISEEDRAIFYREFYNGEVDNNDFAPKRLFEREVDGRLFQYFRFPGSPEYGLNTSKPNHRTSDSSRWLYKLAEGAKYRLFSVLSVPFSFMRPYFDDKGGFLTISQLEGNGWGYFINNDYDDTENTDADVRRFLFSLSMLPDKDYKGHPVLSGYEDKAITVTLKVFDNDINGVAINDDIVTHTLPDLISESQDVTFTLALSARPRAEVAVNLSTYFISDRGLPQHPQDKGVTIVLSQQAIDYYNTHYGASSLLSVDSPEQINDNALIFSPEDWEVERILTLRALPDFSLELRKSYGAKFETVLYDPSSKNVLRDQLLNLPYHPSSAQAKNKLPVVNYLEFDVGTEALWYAYVTPSVNYCADADLSGTFGTIQTCAISGRWEDNYNFSWSEQPAPIGAHQVTVVNLVEPNSSSAQLGYSHMTSTIELFFQLADVHANGMTITLESSEDLVTQFESVPSGAQLVGATVLFLPANLSTGIFSVMHKAVSDTLSEPMESVPSPLEFDDGITDTYRMSYLVNIYDNDLGLFDLAHSLAPPIVLQPDVIKPTAVLLENITRSFNVLGNSSLVSFGIALSSSTTAAWLLNEAAWRNQDILGEDAVFFKRDSWIVTPSIAGLTNTILAPDTPGIMPDTLLTIFGVYTETLFQNTLSPSLSYVLRDDDVGKLTVTFTAATRILIESKDSRLNFEESVTALLSLTPVIHATSTIILSYKNMPTNVLDNSEITAPTITFLPGQQEAVVTLTSIIDGIDDGTQTLDVYATFLSDYIVDLNGYALAEPIDRGWQVIESSKLQVFYEQGLTHSGNAAFMEGEQATMAFKMAVDPAFDATASLTTSSVAEFPTYTLLKSVYFIDAAGDWSALQVINLDIFDDDVMTGPVTSLLNFAFEQSTSLSPYDGYQNNAIVTILDNDVPPATGVITTTIDPKDTTEETAGGVAAADLLAVNEGETVTVGVKLLVKPATSMIVDIILETDDPLYATGVIVLDSLVFGPLDWDTLQDFSITAFDNDVFHGDRDLTITFSYRGDGWVSPIDGLQTSLPLVFKDDDRVNLRLSYVDLSDQLFLDADGLSFVASEGIEAKAYITLLGATPLDPVRVSMEASSSQDVLLPGAQSFLFTSLTWSVSQSFSVLPIEDDVEEGLEQHVLSAQITNVAHGFSDTPTQSLNLELYDPQVINIVTVDGVPPSATAFYDENNVKQGDYLAEIPELLSTTFELALGMPEEAYYYLSSTVDNVEFVYPVAGENFIHFTPSNFNVPQTVHISAATNLFVEVPYLATVQVIPATTIFLADLDFGLKITNSDPATIAISHSTSVLKEANSYSVNVGLSTQPDRPVTAVLSLDSALTNWKLLPSLDATVLVFDAVNWQQATVVLYTGYSSESTDYNLEIDAVVEGGVLSDYDEKTDTYVFEVKNSPFDARIVLDYDHWPDNVFMEGELATLAFGVTGEIPFPNLLLSMNFDSKQLGILSSASQVFEISDSIDPSTSLSYHKCQQGIVYNQFDRCVIYVRVFQDMVLEPNQSMTIDFDLLLGATGAYADRKNVTLQVRESGPPTSEIGTHTIDITPSIPADAHTVSIPLPGTPITVSDGYFVDGTTETYSALLDTLKILDFTLIEQDNDFLTELPSTLPASAVYKPFASVDLLYVSHHYHDEQLGIGFYFDLDGDRYPDFLFNPVQNIVDFVNIHILELQGTPVIEISIDDIDDRVEGEFYGKIFSQKDRFLESSHSIKIEAPEPDILLRSPSDYTFTLHALIDEKVGIFSVLKSAKKCDVKADCSPVESFVSRSDYINSVDRGKNFVFASGSRSGVVPYSMVGNWNIILTNTPSKKYVKRGDVLTYKIELLPKNKNTFNLYYNDFIYDSLPKGFRPIGNIGWMILDGQKTEIALEPFNLNKNVWRFENKTLSNVSKLEIYYQVLVGTKARLGKNKSVTYLTSDPSQNSSPVQDEPLVEVKADPIFDTSLLVGKVFVDNNKNGIQEEGERGVKGVSLLMEDGREIKTDAYGRYHIAQLQKGRHVLRLDERTLPEDLSLLSDRVVLVDADPSRLDKVNFTLYRKPEQADSSFLQQAFLNVVLINKPYVSFLERKRLGDDLTFQIMSNFPSFIQRWQIDIFDGSDRVIHSIVGLQDKIFSPALWDGKDREGNLLLKPNEIYAYRLVAYDRKGLIFETVRDYFEVAFFSTYNALRENENAQDVGISGTNIYKKRLQNGLISSYHMSPSDYSVVSVQALGYQFIRIRNLDTNAEKVFPISFLGVLDHQDPRGRFNIILPKGRYQIKAFK